MVAWSSIFRPAITRIGQGIGVNNILNRNSKKCITLANVQRQSVRYGGGHARTMVVTPSRWQWHRFKDLVHLYIMVGVIPLGAILAYVSLYIGPAELAEIPEGYVPKHWEYNRHPVQRFLARYVYPSRQQEYEKYCHFLYEETEKQQLRRLEKRIKAKMAERNDYQAYYYRPAISKYYHILQKQADELKELPYDLET